MDVRCRILRKIPMLDHLRGRIQDEGRGLTQLRLTCCLRILYAGRVTLPLYGARDWETGSVCGAPTTSQSPISGACFKAQWAFMLRQFSRLPDVCSGTDGCALMCLSRSGGWHTCYTKSGPPFGISTLDDTFIILSDARIIRAEQHHQEVQGMAAR